MKAALVIDDEPAICRCFEALLPELDCDVTVTASAEDGLALAASRTFDVVILDVRLPGMDGVTALPKLRELTDAPIIVMTAHGTLQTAVSIVQEGAFEYLPKPFELDHVTRLLRRALAESDRPAAAPRDPQSETSAIEMVGDSLPMQHLFRQIALAAQHDAPILITGESGTGKELVAHAIHRHSDRSQREIVPVHLASLSEPLLERELFGHEAGAYTGAEKKQAGLIAQADGGTLFLDEIGEAPPGIQVKLLRTIETGEYYPVGSSRPQHSDFRLISATNRPSSFLQSTDSFRLDLYYRLATIRIEVPPLRDRQDDIVKLAQYFLDRNSGGTGRAFTPQAIEALQRHHFPGNVRELRNLVVRAASQSADGQISVEAVVPESSESVDSNAPDAETMLSQAAEAWARSKPSSDTSASLQRAVEIVEAELIRTALSDSNGNRSAAARVLGIHRETLREKAAKYGIE